MWPSPTGGRQALRARPDRKRLIEHGQPAARVVLGARHGHCLLGPACVNRCRVDLEHATAGPIRRLAAPGKGLRSWDT